MKTYGRRTVAVASVKRCAGTENVPRQVGCLSTHPDQRGGTIMGGRNPGASWTVVVCAAAALAVILGACGPQSSPSPAASASATTAPVVQATTATTVGLSAYAASLLDVRHRFLFHSAADIGDGYAKAAEALNLITPPPGYALRHKQLIDKMLLVSGMLSRGSANAATQGFAAGQAEADLLNLAHDADPNSGY